jgi:enamine deaminase RidA (YjgF/YER057c/UK114 family)
MIDSFNPPGIWSPFGAFSMGVVQGDGRTVYLKGQVALDQDGQIVGQDDMKAQVRKVLENIQAVLDHVGGKMGDIVSLTQCVTDIRAFMEAGNVRQEFFAPPFPVTTTVGVAGLYDARLMVEITAIAEIPWARFRRPSGGPDS